MKSYHDIKNFSDWSKTEKDQYSIKVIKGDINNIKITSKLDFEIAKVIMENKNT